LIAISAESGLDVEMPGLEDFLPENGKHDPVPNFSISTKAANNLTNFELSLEVYISEYVAENQEFWTTEKDINFFRKCT